jgi:hypothetical protein
MSTAAELIQRGYREDNIVPIGESPTAAEQTEALTVLNNIISSLYGFELGEQLMDWPVPPPQRTAPVSAHFPLRPYKDDLPANVWPYPPGNTRLMTSITANTAVYLQQHPNDGARVSFVNVGMGAFTLTLNANGRLIENATTAALTSAESPRSWFYRADLGNWQRIADLLAGDQSPFPAEFDDLLICRLSMRLAPRNGKQASDETIRRAGELLVKMKSRYRQPTPALVQTDTFPDSHQSYGWPGSSNLME